jgi:N-acetylglucosaminyl-diphospho-decaprenol L-rhamnosyltransferase
MQQTAGATPPDVSVVIVTYNNATCIVPCLESLAAASAGLGAEIIAVDNHSGDATAAIIRERFPRVRLLVNTANAGFAAAVNQGVDLATGHTLLLLNSDVIIGREALEGLVTACRKQGRQAIFSPRIVNADGTPQHTAFGLFPTFGVLAVEMLLPYRLARRLGLRTIFENSDAAGGPRYEWLSGACLAFSREASQRIGPLDTRFFMYYEDVDFSRRAVEQGYAPLVLEDISVLHIGGVSFAYDKGKSDRNAYINASLLAYLRKHESRSSFLFLRLLLGLGGLLRRFA